MDSKIIKANADGVKEVLKYLKGSTVRYLDIRNLEITQDGVDHDQLAAIHLKVYNELRIVIGEVEHALNDKPVDSNQGDFPDFKELIEI